MSEILIQTGQTLLKPSQPAEPEPSTSFDLLHILRIIFYIIVVVKLIQLSFLRRKKHSLKERVYRKFLFAHQELLKQFTQEDKANMEHTLNNTIKNANVEFKGTRTKQTKNKKRVNFSVQKNNYYDPKQWKNDCDDQDMYLDVEDTRGDIFFENPKDGDVRDKMIEEEFGERQNLQKINEKEEEIQIQASKLTQETQSSSLVGVPDASQVSDLPVESKDSLLSNSSNKGEVTGDEEKQSVNQMAFKKNQ